MFHKTDIFSTSSTNLNGFNFQESIQGLNAKLNCFQLAPTCYESSQHVRHRFSTTSYRLVFLDQNTDCKFYIEHVIRVLLDKHDKFVAIHARNVASDTWKMQYE